MSKILRFSLAGFDAIEQDDEELHMALKRRFGRLDVKSEWRAVARGLPVTSLLKSLPPRLVLPRRMWEKSRETTREYLEYHFKYALLRNDQDMDSSRHVVGCHLKDLPDEILHQAFGHVETNAQRLYQRHAGV